MSDAGKVPGRGTPRRLVARMQSPDTIRFILGESVQRLGLSSHGKLPEFSRGSSSKGTPAVLPVRLP